MAQPLFSYFGITFVICDLQAYNSSIMFAY